MALTAAQIITLSLQIAKAPGYTAQAGQLLNVVLSDLAQTYDLDAATAIFNFSFVVDNGSGNGSGPYNLPADFLRCNPDDVFYTIQGVPFPMINKSTQEYDWLVQQPGIASYPLYYATDLKGQGQNPATPAQMFVWPPASGAYPVTVRYFRQMPDYATPEGSTAIPWFQNQNYLITRLAGELMKITDDTRWNEFLSDKEDSDGAGDILRKYLKLQGDSSARPKTVRLARQRFGRNFNLLPNTKTIGW
jgi:hypothetical protein